MLYSGGHENVLVFWNMCEGMSRDFFPRHSAAITKIIPLQDSEDVFLSLADDSIRLISPANVVTSNLPLFVEDRMNSEFSGPVTVSPNNLLVANGHPGMLQFVNVDSAVVKFELDITHMNNVTGSNKLLPVWRISAFDFSPHNYLCTVESCEGLLKCGVLKFFSPSTTTENEYKLDFCVEGVDVTKPVFVRACPKWAHFAVCVGNIIQIWALNVNTWQLLRELSHRNLPPIVADYSFDGSILTAACENILVLWNTEEEYKCYGELGCKRKY